MGFAEHLKPSESVVSGFRYVLICDQAILDWLA